MPDQPKTRIADFPWRWVAMKVAWMIGMSFVIVALRDHAYWTTSYTAAWLGGMVSMFMFVRMPR